MLKKNRLLLLTLSAAPALATGCATHSLPQFGLKGWPMEQREEVEVAEAPSPTTTAAARAAEPPVVAVQVPSLDQHDPAAPLPEVRPVTFDDAGSSQPASPQPASFRAGETGHPAGGAVELATPLAMQPEGLQAEPHRSAGETVLAPGTPMPLDAGRVTLDAVEQWALAHNPAIQQAAAASSRAGGIRTQVGLKPNPTIGYFGEEIGNDGGSAGLQGGFISQTFVRGDKLEWNRAVINNDVRAMNRMIETQRQRILTDVRLAFYEALAAQKRLQLARDFREIAAQGVDVSQQRVDAKVGTRPDVLQSEIQLGEIDLTIQQTQYQLEAARNQLQALCGGIQLGDDPLVGELDQTYAAQDADSLYAHIVAANPLLAAAEARVDRARANVQRQRLQPVPNVTAQLGAGHDDGTGDAFANVQLSLPLPIHNRNQGNIQAAHAEYCNAIKNVERIRLSIQQQLAETLREYKIAEATVNQYKQSIMPKAEETLELIQQAQAAGEFDFLRVLTARRAYFDANLRYVTALGELAQADARLEGLLLSGGLSQAVTYEGQDELRGQALSGQ
ncbi:TolC family protein [Roseimaritima sediminicola]|uniref:TolC family protein n=1 Tax=Roseimaritima sediminicola TaxID=2662066 RepID=UPI00129827B0|nr:TolC family protein [Roseimaritima sediminicola]